MKKSRRVMVFGVFDRLHDGHRSFLHQAAQHGKELIVIAARDAAVQELKRKTPAQTEWQRMAALRRVPGVWKTVLGDREQGMYHVIKKWKPDVICLGYDQRGLERDLRQKIKASELPEVRIERMKPEKRNHWHTSLLNLDKKGKMR